RERSSLDGPLSTLGRKSVPDLIADVCSLPLLQVSVPRRVLCRLAQHARSAENTFLWVAHSGVLGSLFHARDAMRRWWFPSRTPSFWGSAFWPGSSSSGVVFLRSGAASSACSH